MSGRNNKAIQLHAKVLLAKWLNHLVAVSEQRNIPMSEVKKLLPKQEYIYVDGKTMLSAYSFKWVVKALKALKRQSPDRGIETFTMTNVEAWHSDKKVVNASS